MLAETGADPSLRDALAAALEANRQLAELTGKLREENARLREDNARLLARSAERDAELDRVRADLAVLQRMLFGRSSERSRTLGPFLGTRHTSALRFTADEPSTLVFVVSSSGPLSVFCRGERLDLT